MITDNLKKLISTPIAHRGLFNEEIAENSISAFKNAFKNGYGIETDVYLTKDERLVCFHDKSLLRLFKRDEYIYNLTLNEIKELSSVGKEKIPTLEELLNATSEKDFLLIEIKNQPNKKVVDKTVEILKNFKGNFAIQSFNPFYIKRVKKLAPNFLRGILSDKYPDTESKLERWVVKNMPFNFLAKPHFISYNYKYLPLDKKKRKSLPVLAWTVTDKETHDKIKPFCDNVIFENFLP